MLRASIIITCCNDKYINSLLSDLKNSNFHSNDLEILLVEAGSYSREEALSALGEKATLLRFWCIKSASRTKSLNFLIKQSSSNLIIRLDARTQIAPDYIEKIIALSDLKKVSNVGGVMLPIGSHQSQKMIAKFMLHPLALGGGKSRKQGYSGYVDSIYLGAFRKDLMPPEPWFEESYPQISEDSDLNLRIRLNGGLVFLESSIAARYFARETISSFCKLAKNYGVARGLFFFKNKTITNSRQLALPLGLLLVAILACLALHSQLALHIFGAVVGIYILMILAASISLATKFIDLYFYFPLFFLTHLSWTAGFYYALIIFFKKND